MKKIECGQMTIFLSLLLISFLLVLSVCIEGIYVHMQKANFMEQQILLGEYAQANYQKDLLEQFHLFAIDGRYCSKMEVSLKNKWKQNTGISPVNLMIADQKSLVDEDGEILKYQIREYMKYEETADMIQKIKETFLGVENDEDVEQMDQSFKNTQNAKEQEEKKQKEQSDKTAVTSMEDPRKALKKILSGGILAIVMPEGKEISKQSIFIKYEKENQEKDETIDFLHLDSVSKLFQTNQKNNAINQISTEGLSTIYAVKYFQNVTESKKDTGIQYEVEYLISGKDSDQKNLKAVVNRLLAIRFALNYSYLLSSSEKQSEAYTLATAISSAGGALPGVIESVKLLIMAAWAYGEAIVDVRELLRGNKVVLVKNEENWQVSLANLATLSTTKKPSKTGITYEDYLKILLLLQKNSNEKYKRMMDLIEQRIKEKQSDFQLSECIFSYKMTIEEKIPGLFYETSYNLNNSRIFVY